MQNVETPSLLQETSFDDLRVEEDYPLPGAVEEEVKIESTPEVPKVVTWMDRFLHPDLYPSTGLAGINHNFEFFRCCNLDFLRESLSLILFNLP